MATDIAFKVAILAASVAAGAAGYPVLRAVLPRPAGTAEPR